MSSDTDDSSGQDTGTTGADRTTGLVAVAGELYGLVPEEFTAARNDRAKQLRGDGDKDTAAAVKKLRKPATAAWVVNMLMRHEADQMQQLLELGQSLRAAQDELDAEALRELTRQRRRLTTAVTGQGRDLARELGHKVSDAVADQVQQTLHAAMTDESAAAAVRSGLLVEPLAATGLEQVDVAEAVAVPEAVGAPRPPAAPAAAAAPNSRRTGGEAKAEETADRKGRRGARPKLSVVEDAERRHQERVRRLEEARQEAEKATAAADKADRKVGKAGKRVSRLEARSLQLQSELDELRRRVGELEHELEGVDDDLAEAEAKRERAEERRDRARADAEQARAAVEEAQRQADEAQRRLDEA